MNITVIGAGSAGLAISGHLALQGHSVCLYNRTPDRISSLLESKTIVIKGKINKVAKLSMVTSDIKYATKFGDIIMVATVANAHKDLAISMSDSLRAKQVILLNPGRTGGLLEYRNALDKEVAKKVYIAEAQTLVYACREIRQGEVEIIGIKERVLLAGINTYETNYVITALSVLYSCFYPAKNYFQTGLENIGAIFHPPVVIFNAALIDRGQTFYFYRDMSKRISDYILGMDEERLRIGKALNIELQSVEEWIAYAYAGICGNDFLEKIKNNPAYNNIISPPNLFSRQLTEDIPTGLIPMTEFGKAVGVETPMMNSLIDIGSLLLKINFREQGRTLQRLGIKEADLCLE